MITHHCYKSEKDPKITTKNEETENTIKQNNISGNNWKMFHTRPQQIMSV